jgi:tartrate-resistant acid phosphatase type 5
MRQLKQRQIFAWLVILPLTAAIATAQRSSSPLLAASQVVAATNEEKAIESLPPRLRRTGRALLNERDDDKRAALADELAKEPNETTVFLLTVLDADKSPLVRRAIVNRLGRVSDARIAEAMKRHAASDADVGISILAADRFRMFLMRDAAALISQRMELARERNDKAGLRQLEQEQERWISLVNGVMLPSFLRVPPPLFSVKDADQPVRFLAFGDFGTGSNEQKRLALVMQQVNKQKPFDFGLTLGDNFYQDGMTGTNDPRWRSWWEDIYSPLGIKFYATLGNHDWYGADSPASEILYSQQSATWRMPAPYYTFTAGCAQFFAIDTNEMSEAQISWLKDELAKSRARWKIVYGHHPIFSASANGGGSQKLQQTLLPILSGRVDLYLAGHNHNLQHLNPANGVDFLIVGGGGQKLDRIKKGERALFAREEFGFAAFDVKTESLKASLIGADGKTLYEYTLKK